VPTGILVAAAFAPSLILKGKEILGSGILSWHTIQAAGGETLSLAGWWWTLISIPVYRVLNFRWAWVLVMWAVLLTKVSKLDLNCVATHPDKVGGFGFLAQTQQFFAPVAFAGSAVIASGFANQLAYGSATISSLKFLMISACVLGLILFVAPLFVLTPKLFELKESGLAEYGALGNTYVQAFDSKWVKRNVPVEETLLGSADIQSLADLSNSFSVISEMGYMALTKEVLLILTVAIVLPMIVLLIAVSPADEVIGAILKLLA
jgi:hypothetical protein